MKKLNYIIASLIFTIAIVGCNTGDLDPTLAQNKDATTGITKVDNLYAVLKGALSRMTSSQYYGRDYIITDEVRTDNCFSNGNSGRFTTQAGFTYSANTAFIWDNAYAVISSANLIINTDITQLEGDQDYGQHLQGQAYFLRALAHFDLLKTYGQQNVGGTLGVPYVTKYLTSESDPADLVPARNTVDEVKTAILNDLQTAFDMMGNDDKTLPSKYAAKALESRVDVYFKMWPEAKLACEAVINSHRYSIMAEDAFVKSWEGDHNANSIFELAFSSTDNRGSNSLAYIYRTTGGGSYGDIQVLDEVADLFEPTDVRGLPVAGSDLGILGYEDGMLRNIGKYPENQGYDNVPLIRYEEVILNYAEALFETGGDAVTQLNEITSNRGASPYTDPITLEDILNERRKELMFEGFRYDDLVRTGHDIEKISIQQNFSSTIPYGDYRMAWPIPTAEMNANSNMIQNDGY
jgi:hypothetical protein